MWAKNMEKAEIRKKASYDNLFEGEKAYGGVNSDGKEIDSKDDLFDSKGTLNAYDKKDAVAQQMRFASVKERYALRKKTSSFYTASEKEAILEAAFSGGDAERLRFGAAMIPLIIDRLDYEGFIRQVFRTHEVPQGQIISYEKDVNVAAIIIQEDGQTVSAVSKGNRVFVPEFMITCAPRISLAEIAQRQFDIVDRTHDKATFQIMFQEDRAGLKALYQASTTENTQIAVTSTLDKTFIENIVHEVERHRLLVDKIIMNRQELGDLRKNINAMEYDPETSRDVLMTGIFGSIWNYNIFISAGVDEPGIQNVAVPAGMIFAVAEPRYLGAMPVRIGLRVMPADQFINNKVEYGWLFVEQIGMVVVNPRAVSVGVKTGVTAPAWMS